MLFICTKCKNEINSLNKPEFCPKCKNSSFTKEKLLTLAPKVQIADFKLIKIIGKGGMGEVWLAEQISTSSLIALKLLYPSFNQDDDFKNRFMNEVKNSLQLNHPSIVKTIDTGCYKGIYYLATEFIKGKILEQKLLEEKKNSEKQGLLIGLSIAKALAYAWNNFKILHRDIKPSNIIINLKGFVTILDFGVAKNLADDISLTIEGEVVGTPFYMSPEQSKSENIDCKADIYSLGATLYHILTGVVPYKGTSPMSILAKHITDDLVPPIEKNTDLSEATSELIERMMTKDKSQRYQTWEKVIQAIENILSGNTSAEQIKSTRKYLFNRKKKDILPSDELQKNNKKLKSSSASHHLNLKPQNKELEDSINKQYIPPSIYDYDDSSSTSSKRKTAFLSNKLPLISALSLIIILLFIFAYFIGYIKLEEQFNYYFVSQFKNFLNNLSSNILQFINNHTFFEIKHIEFSLNIYDFSIGIVAVLIFMLSAFWSAYIAEKYKKNRLIMFLLGLIFPIIIPIIGNKFFNMQSYKVIAKNGEKTHNIDQSEEINYKQNLFKELIYNEEGKPNGPFKFELFDNSTLYVTEILEVQDKLLVLKTENTDGSSSKIRLPYKKIKTFNKA